MKAWNVYEAGTLVDTVYFLPSMGADEIKRQLQEDRAWDNLSVKEKDADYLNPATHEANMKQARLNVDALFRAVHALIKEADQTGGNVRRVHRASVDHVRIALSKAEGHN